MELNKLPTLLSERLTKGPISLKDAFDMFEYSIRDNVGPNAGWIPHKTIEETKNI